LNIKTHLFIKKKLDFIKENIITEFPQLACVNFYTLSKNYDITGDFYIKCNNRPNSITLNSSFDWSSFNLILKNIYIFKENNINGINIQIKQNHNF
jgi:hypothetical protein